jgi:hypothetical protein
MGNSANISHNLVLKQGGVYFYNCKFNKYEGTVYAFNLSAKTMEHRHK